MNRSCYIVDDENHAIDLLMDFVTQTAGLELAGHSNSPIVALEEMSAGTPPDIAFLDIDMPQLSGLQLARLINGHTAVIITTSFREYALDAFDTPAIDYLLKPISYERFLKSIQKIRKYLPDLPNATRVFDPFIFIKTGLKNQFMKVAVADIRYIAASLNYVELFVKERKLVTYMGLSAVLDKLPPADFTQIHKSHIINHRFIETLDYGQVTMSDLMIIPVGRVYRKAFHRKMKTSFSKGHYDD